MINVCIPKPMQIVIDDVGWWSGHDGSAQQEPYRTGLSRDHCLADYEAIVYLGESLGMRPQAAMVLCEWDRENILRDLPDSTWMGSGWDNSARDSQAMDTVAAYLLQHRNAIELTLHGLGHEFWADGEFTRAEWFDEQGQRRPTVEQHLEYFARLLQMNKLGKFPESFVPCAFKYCFGAAEKGMAAQLAARGVKMLSTPFSTMVSRRDPLSTRYGFEDGLMVVDRGEDIAPWNALAFQPDAALKISDPIIGMHWPNVLHADPQRNKEVVDGWVRFLRRQSTLSEWMLASDTDDFCTQLVHAESTRCIVDENSVELNCAALRRFAWPHFQRKLQVKLSADRPLLFSAAAAELVEQRVDEHEDGFQYTLDLQLSEKYDDARLSWVAAVH